MSAANRAETQAPAAGRLFIVSTPIGNLGDITRRAVEVLGAAQAVAAEDTRRSRALLSHLGIGNRPVLALHAHSSDGALAAVIERLLAGEDVALVTDAGTPAVSDPGRALVALARARGVAIHVIPGPSAVTAAVALSGLVEGPFTFVGFWPRQPAARREAVQRVAKSREAVVFFESPQRLSDTLRELAAELPEREAFIGRELTKLHEEGVAGRLSELAVPERSWRGEIVAVVAPSRVEPDADAERRGLVFASLRVALESGASPSRVARGLAEASGFPRRELYERALAIQAELGLGSEEAPGGRDAEHVDEKTRPPL
jgi:16S rRNA (cytidine1402-2'-O)-methyltransferase